MESGIITMAGWLSIFIWSVLVMSAQVHGDQLIDITFLKSAIPKGAVCLDGSPPAYSYFEGYGNGSNSWIVYLQSGGWCSSKIDCYNRSTTPRGSTYPFIGNQTNFSGLLDTNSTFNPDFYNWHKVYIYYCDGSSFMSDIKHVDPRTNVTYRGARIFKVVMEELLSKGMGNAQNAMLVGTSAGAMTTTLHCDKFRKLFQKNSRVKCVSDSGFIIHGKGLLGDHYREKYYADVIRTHGLRKSLPKSCTSKMNPNLCLFPEYYVGDIQTPLFLLESAFDAFQIEYNTLPAVGGRLGWSNCLGNLRHCNSTQLGIMRDFRNTFIGALLKLKHSLSRGMFVHSCYLHGHILIIQEWTCSSLQGNNILANKTIAQAISDWYFDRTSFRQIDVENDLPRNCSSSLTPELFVHKCLATLSTHPTCSYS
ncbi:pectin acetylesterase 11-like [Salvia hispanica]|uniref:pectin acetylesterase 11-like n=1 Tax=Salvia hispanica TaxID=49212 RepID=UPI0020095E31|nr:pectin acetylesterase 11-like [Salvia hispanica]